MNKDILELNNLAKYRIGEELIKTFESEPGRVFEILDVGVTGPRPLGFWRPFLKYPNFRLTGVDVDKESIARLKQETLPEQVVALEALSGYDIAERYGDERFDIVVSTQVLEHMKHPERFIEAAFRVLKSGGAFLICYDSGEYPRKKRVLKEFAKDVAVRISGSERYHDKDIAAADVRRMLETSGFIDLELRRYNVHPLKRIQNHELEDEDDRLRVLDAWKRLEETLNEVGHARRHPEYYLGAYFKALKP